MRDELKENFPDITLVFDKRVDNGCSLRRPDVRIEMHTHTIIVECDENRHSGYEAECEHRRLMELFQDLGNKPLVVIRFNPDSYKDGNEVIGSCFSQTKTGALSLNKKEWNSRIKVLVKQIKKWTESVPTKELTEELLFY